MKKAPLENPRILDEEALGIYVLFLWTREEEEQWVKLLKPPASMLNSPRGYEGSCLCPGCPRMLLNNLELPGMCIVYSWPLCL